MASIKCKHDEHVDQKALVDPRAHVIPIAQQWIKIAYDPPKDYKLANDVESKMCKDKWNRLNLDYNKFSNYHKGTSHNIFFGDLTIDKFNKFHLSK